MTLLEVRNLTTAFQTGRGEITAIEDVSFDLDPGEILGIVGESGSGKSVTALTIMGLLPRPPARVAGGAVRFDGPGLTTLSDSRMQRIRGPGIAMVFQEPMTSLNPVFTIGEQIMETIRAHERLPPRALFGARGGDAGEGRHPLRRDAHERLSAPAVRRPAAARDARHRAGLPAAPADRRRADDRAGRHHPGTDPRPDAGPARRVRHGDHDHHPQHGRDRRDRRPGAGDVCRPHRRAGAGRPAVRPSAASLHTGPAGLRAVADAGEGRGCVAIPGTLPEPSRRPRGLPLSRRAARFADARLPRRAMPALAEYDAGHTAACIRVKELAGA